MKYSYQKKYRDYIKLEDSNINSNDQVNNKKNFLVQFFFDIKKTFIGKMLDKKK
jgi:hypothetical protein